MTSTAETTEQIAMLLDELSRVLWKQRELIDVLHYRLEIQHMLLVSSRTSRLEFALAEVEGAMAAIREVETERDRIVRNAAVLMGLAENATITQLREAAPEPFAEVLAEHQRALLALVAETERTAASSRELSQRGANEMRAVMGEIAGTTQVTAYGPNAGRSGVSTLVRPALLDREV